MPTVQEFPRPVREIENVFIELADGCRLAARIWLPADAEADPVPAILEYLPYRKRDGTSQRDAPDPSLLRRPRLRLRAGRHARQRRVRRPDARRVHGAGAGRRARGDRLARAPALVHRRGRHDRDLLGRLQRPAGRGAPPAGAEGGDQPVLDRRSLRRRHPLHGRLPAQRQPELGVDHVRLFLAPAGPGARRRALARAVAAPAREYRAPGRGMAAPPAPRPAVAARLGVRELRCDPMPGLRRGRLGRRLFQRDPAPACGLERAEEGPDRPLGAPISRISPRPARRSASSRSACAGGTSG